MSVAGAIRAGSAYIEVFLDQNPVARGLTAMQTRLRGWSASRSRMGSGVFGGALPGPLGAIAQFASSPAGIFGGLLMASKTFASVGDDLDKMSSRVGASVEFLSALSHAAKIGGTELSAMEVGIRRLQRTTYDASRGLSTAKDAFADLGINIYAADGQLKGTEQLFMESAAALSKMENNTKKAALATVVFGRAGTSLLPMLRDGPEGLMAVMEEAKRLGLVMSTEDATAAAVLTDAMTRLMSVMKMAVVRIGGGLAPVLSDLSDRIAAGSLPALEWIKSHGELFQLALKGAAAIIAGGLAFSLLGLALGLVGRGIGVLLIPFRLLSGLVGTVTGLVAGAFSILTGAVSAAGAALGFLLTPMGLLIGTAAALAGYFLWSSGAIGNAANWLVGVFAGLADDARKTFGGISDALAAGDIALAAKVLWAMLKLEWQKGIAFLEGLWAGFKGFWNDAVVGLAIIFTNATAKVKTLWAEMIGWMEKKWNAFKLSGFTETLASWLAPIFAKIQGVSVEDTQKALQEDFARGRSAQPQSEAAIDAATKARTDEIERERKATEQELAKDKLRADRQRQERIDAARAEVDAARQELDDAVAQAREARDHAAASGPESLGKRGVIPELGSLMTGKANVVGTFSGQALSGLGAGNTIEEKMEKHLAQIAENTDRQNTAIERLERNMNQGILLA